MTGERPTVDDAAPAAVPGGAPAPASLVARISLLVGLVLLGLSLLHAVTAVSPLLSTIEADIGLGATGATILGMLPTIAFGVAGFTAAAL
ncbi:MAG TPA: hypothetical protein VF559_08480 [Caulobacteraceae bacterium]